MTAWLVFIGSAAVTIFAGRKLSHYGDDIATHTGLGRAWVGAILLAGATSLPEVATSVAAAAQGAGNLAMGNVFGSNIFNIAILVLAQLAAVRPMLATAALSHVTVAAAGMMLSGIAAVAMVVRYPGMVGGVGFDTLLIAGAYILLLRLLPKDEEGQEQVKEAAATSAQAPAQSGAALWGKFIAAAGVVIVAGYFLSTAADQIAEATGLGQTFVGGTLLAAATSLPELTVTIVTARQGLYDLAIGNVLGSNIFNMLILVLADVALPGKQTILSSATQGQVVAAMVGLILSGIAVLGLSVRNRTSGRPFQWDMGAIGLAYVAGTWFLYQLR